MIGRTPRFGRIDALKPKRTQIEFIGENVDPPHWVFFGYVTVQTLRQQRDWRPRLTLNESLHDRPRHDLDHLKVRQSEVFSHSPGRFRSVVTGRNRRLYGNSEEDFQILAKYPDSTR